MSKGIPTDPARKAEIVAKIRDEGIRVTLLFSTTLVVKHLHMATRRCSQR
jgi:hypothetical protein